MSWEKVKLEDLYDVHNGLSKGGKFFGSGYPFITFSTVFNNFFLPDEITDYVQSTEKEQASYSILRGDVFVTRTSETSDELGMSCVALKDYPRATYNGFTKRMRPKDNSRVYPEYIGYYMRMPRFRAEFQAFSTMTTRASLRNEDLLSLYVNLPPYQEQVRIAETLRNYDLLIKNNLKQIKLLEEAAQRLYKEWFVDLRFPGHETTPITDGIPEGWEDKTMEDICDSVGGGTPSTKNDEYYRDGKIKWVTPTDITRKNGLILLDTEKKITKEGLQHSSAKMVPPHTILMTSRASVGFFGLCAHEVCTNQGFISCIPYKENTRFYLLYSLMNRVDEIRAKASGSTFLEISKKNFRGLRVVLPSDNVLDVFTKLVVPMVQQMEVLTKSIETLQEARDRLLPKLMNKEIEV